MRFYLYIFIINALLTTKLAAQSVETIAGIPGEKGLEDAIALSAKFDNPHGICQDRDKNIFVCDRFNHCIRKIDSAGNVTLVAGNGSPGYKNGLAEKAQFNEPWDIEADSKGNLYVADAKNNRIRKITPDGLVSNYAGTGSFGMTDAFDPKGASFGWPSGLTFGLDSVLYVAGHLTHLIRTIEPSGRVSTLAGKKTGYPNNFGKDDGFGQQATFFRPYGLCLDLEGNILVADEWNSLIRRVTPQGLVTTVAGMGKPGYQDGTALNAMFNFPWDVEVDSEGRIYVGDGYNHTIRVIDEQSQTVSTLTGQIGQPSWQDGAFEEAGVSSVTSFFYRAEERSVYFTCSYNQTVRKLYFGPQALISVDSIICFPEEIQVLLYPDSKSEYRILLNDIPAEIETFRNVIKKDSVNEYELKILNRNNGIELSRANFTIRRSDVQSIYPSNERICPNSSIELTVGQQENWIWNNDQIGNTITVSEPGSYFALYDAKCGGYTDTVDVGFYPVQPVKLNIANQQYSRCFGDTALIVPDIELDWVWNTGYWGNRLSVHQPGNFWAVGIDENECVIASDTIEIDYFEVPVKSVLNANNSFDLCEQDSVQLETEDFNEWSWMSSEMDTVDWIKESGVYFGLFIDEDGCYNYTDSIRVTVHENPEENIVRTDDGTLLVDFEGTVVWNNGLIAQQVLNPVSQSYWATLESPYGCFGRTDTLELFENEIIPELGEQLIFPTGFSPNNDNVNETFLIKGLDLSAENRFCVFNRWGELIFESLDYMNHWDGNSNEGSEMPVGTYYYILETQSSQYQGYVIINK